VHSPKRVCSRRRCFFHRGYLFAESHGCLPLDEFDGRKRPFQLPRWCRQLSPSPRAEARMLSAKVLCTVSATWCSLQRGWSPRAGPLALGRTLAHGEYSVLFPVVARLSAPSRTRSIRCRGRPPRVARRHLGCTCNQFSSLFSSRTDGRDSFFLESAKETSGSYSALIKDRPVEDDIAVTLSDVWSDPWGPYSAAYTYDDSTSLGATPCAGRQNSTSIVLVVS
jgi:hypothetical protein